MFHHFAHLKEIVVKEGQRVKRGDLIGFIGSTGASTSPHLHFEIHVNKPSSWTQYTQGMTREEVARAYVDPARYIDAAAHIPAKYDRFTGYQFLDKIDGLNQFHPGADINSGKDGDDDLGAPALASCDGVIPFVGWDGKSGGWGNHLFIEEEEHDYSDQIDMKAAKGFGLRPYPFFLAVEPDPKDGVKGKIWFIHEDGTREYISPDGFYAFMEKYAVGIANRDLFKSPIKKDV